VFHQNTISNVRHIKSWFESDKVVAYLFVVPLVIIIGGLIGFPLCYAVWLSFTDKMIARSSHFIGFTNYINLFHERLFSRVVSNSFIYVFGSVSIKTILGMGIALLLNQKFRGRNIARGITLVPWIAPAIAAALTIRWMYDDMFGIINFFLFQLGLIKYPVPWLADKTLAKLAVISAGVWKGIPFFIMSFLAGLQTIPLNLYEASKIDGASVWQSFRYITIPHMLGIILLVSSLSTIWTLNDFNTIWIMTGGGPSYGTEVIATFTYRVGFIQNMLGKAVATSLYLIPILSILVYIATRTIYRGET